MANWCWFVTASMVLALAVSAAGAQPEIMQTMVSYDVSGTTLDEVRTSLDKNGPIDPRSERRFHAMTRWSVQLQYNHSMNRERCYVDSATALVEITTTLPQLKAKAETPPEVVRAFTAYVEKLQLHEKGHGEIAVLIAQRAEAAVAEHPPRLTCDELGRDIGALAERIIRNEGPRLDAEYDERTQYGRTQGAIFP